MWCQKNQNDDKSCRCMADVLVSAKRLQTFFNAAVHLQNQQETQVREQLLQEIPVSCNYEYHPKTLVTELCAFHPSTKDLAFHLKLKFCVGCEIRLTQSFYNRLKVLRNIQSSLLGRRRLRPPLRLADDGFSVVRLLAGLKLI